MALCAYQANATTWRTTQVSPDACGEAWRVVTTQEYAEYQTLKAQVIAPVEEFDYALGGQVFGLFFSSVVGIYLLAKNIGLVLEAIKRW